MNLTAPGNDGDPLCGKEVANGRYFVERVLGKGGMGTVYAALQRPINRKVALKLIHRELVGNAEVVGRFLQEMRLTATIEHPHTVRLYDVGEIDGQPFLTTEFLEGRTLRAELASAGAFAQARLCNVGVQIAKALRAAHEHDVVHRDLKPDNVMLLDSYGERDYVKVLDFGIARSLVAQAGDLHTRTGALLGTPAYMSPEQCEGRAVDGRSDLYALGILLFELASGAPPFPLSHTLPQLLMDHVAHPPPDIRACVRGLAEPVAALMMALLEKSPDDRPPSAEVVVNLLASFAQATPSSGISAPAAEPPAVAKTQVLPGTEVAAPTKPREGRTQPPRAEVAIAPLPGRLRVAMWAVVALVLILGGAGWFLFHKRASVSAEAVAAALTLPGEPAFPVSCVSAHDRDQVLAAATGKASWSSVPAASIERRLAEARAADAGDATARAKLEAVVAACPASAVARTLLGKALARLDQDESAIVQLKAAVKLAWAYVPARFALAVALVKQGDGAQAMPLVTSVLADEPQNVGARLLRGQLRIAAGDKQGAIGDLRAYTAAQPQAGAVWALLGEALAQVGDSGAAQAAFCRAVDLGIERVRPRCPGR